jgi:hypothetical protein
MTRTSRSLSRPTVPGVAACRCGATTPVESARTGWFVGLDTSAAVCPACSTRRQPAELLGIARDALRAVGLDVPDDATPHEILALADRLMEGHR